MSLRALEAEIHAQIEREALESREQPLRSGDVSSLGKHWRHFTGFDDDDGDDSNDTFKWTTPTTGMNESVSLRDEPESHYPAIGSDDDDYRKRMYKSLDEFMKSASEASKQRAKYLAADNQDGTLGDKYENDDRWWWNVDEIRPLPPSESAASATRPRGRRFRETENFAAESLKAASQPQLVPIAQIVADYSAQLPAIVEARKKLSAKSEALEAFEQRLKDKKFIECVLAHVQDARAGGKMLHEFVDGALYAAEHLAHPEYKAALHEVVQHAVDDAEHAELRVAMERAVVADVLANKAVPLDGKVRDYFRNLGRAIIGKKKKKKKGKKKGSFDDDDDRYRSPLQQHALAHRRHEHPTKGVLGEEGSDRDQEWLEYRRGLVSQPAGTSIALTGDARGSSSSSTGGKREGIGGSGWTEDMLRGLAEAVVDADPTGRLAEKVIEAFRSEKDASPSLGQSNLSSNVTTLDGSIKDRLKRFARRVKKAVVGLPAPMLLDDASNVRTLSDTASAAARGDYSSFAEVTSGTVRVTLETHNERDKKVHHLIRSDASLPCVVYRGEGKGDEYVEVISLTDNATAGNLAITQRRFFDSNNRDSPLHIEVGLGRGTRLHLKPRSRDLLESDVWVARGSSSSKKHPSVFIMRFGGDGLEEMVAVWSGIAYHRKRSMAALLGAIELGLSADAAQATAEHLFSLVGKQAETDAMRANLRAFGECLAHAIDALRHCGSPELNSALGAPAAFHTVAQANHTLPPELNQVAQQKAKALAEAVAQLGHEFATTSRVEGTDALLDALEDEFGDLGNPRQIDATLSMLSHLLHSCVAMDTSIRDAAARVASLWKNEAGALGHFVAS